MSQVLQRPQCGATDIKEIDGELKCSYCGTVLLGDNTTPEDMIKYVKPGVIISDPTRTMYYKPI